MASAARPDTEDAAPRKRQASTSSRVRTAVESLGRADIRGEYLRGKSLDIILDGARLLAINDLYAIHHFQRIAYRKAWHEAMRAAVLALTGGPRHCQRFDCFRVQALRQAPRLCDEDALDSQFKYAIDGLRYAGMLIDDDPTHMVQMGAVQQLGSYLVRLRIDAVDPASPLAAARRKEGIEPSVGASRVAGCFSGIPGDGRDQTR